MATGVAGRVFVVANPASGKGRGARRLEPVLAALRRHGCEVEHGLTQAPGDEARLTRAAIGRGFESVVALGGDGTWSNVGNAIIASGAPVRLGLMAGGTGCDLARSLDVPGRDVDACARIVAAGHTRRIDVGQVAQRHFLNVLGFGFDIAVIEDSWRVKRLTGELVYLYCALRQIYAFPGFPVEIEGEGLSGRHELLMLVVSNARVFGGGFRVAPQARLDDGRLDLTAFANMSPGRRLAVLVALLRGVHGRAPEVHTAAPTELRLRFERPPAYEVDGEWCQAQSSELHVRCLPRALDVLAPPAS